MPFSYASIVHAVAERARLDEETAARALHATLAIVGRRLRRVDAEVVASRLPPELGAALLDQPYEGACSAEEMLQRSEVSDERLSNTIIRVLAERLDEQARAQLRVMNLRKLIARAPAATSAGRRHLA